MEKIESFVKKRKEKKGKMVKEFFICTMILILIVIGNGITQGYSRSSIENINEKLTNLREEMNKEENATINKEPETIKNESIKKEEINNTLTFFQ